MDESITREKVIDEVKLVPEDKLQELYEVVRGFSVAASAGGEGEQGLMRLAGCWGDIAEGEFHDFLHEIAQRRAQAFSSRRSR